MTDRELDNYIDLLKKAGWKVELNDTGAVRLNESFSRRYPQIPEGITILRDNFFSLDR